MGVIRECAKRATHIHRPHFERARRDKRPSLKGPTSENVFKASRLVLCVYRVSGKTRAFERPERTRFRILEVSGMCVCQGAVFQEGGRRTDAPSSKRCSKLNTARTCVQRERELCVCVCVFLIHSLEFRCVFGSQVTPTYQKSIRPFEKTRGNSKRSC